ncbi:hypothetical protein RFI_20396 [Reticulomyxa filosa]|uniref:Major facilitator superfamily (MFS) profile domain-containing protein n=1 Tax=Reticulomyxa filosa TaxID=46433 RepID=X6MU42_RETFI|nr:hypothetical protein RFI_20396 [Reticulomyxa filosa]|eukprot:ETO16942.1 hypothetical protein RFI_20396 [Reticulomyxa filosa]
MYKYMYKYMYMCASTIEYDFSLNETSQFPVCLDWKSEETSEETKVTTRQQRKWLNFPPLTAWERFILTNTYITCACISATSAILATYYTAFMKDHFSVGILTPTSQLSLIAVFMIVGAVLSYVLDERLTSVSDRHSDRSRYLWTGVFLGVHFLMFVSAYPQSPSWAYWLFTVVTGVSSGAALMFQTFVLLTIQPFRHSGKLVGLRVAFSTLFGMALATLLVGIAWDVSNDKCPCFILLVLLTLLGFYLVLSSFVSPFALVDTI